MTAAEILQKHEDANEMHLHHVDRKWVIQAMEEYAKFYSQRLETLAKLLAKTWFYGEWEWENPNERIQQMIMQDLGYYPFKDEDEMIRKTKVDEYLYKEAVDKVALRNPRITPVECHNSLNICDKKQTSITAEEFFRNKIKEKNPLIDVVTLSQHLVTAEEAMRWSYEFSQLEKSEIPINLEISDMDIKKKRWEDFEEFNKRAQYPEDCASPYADGFTRGAKWVLEQIKNQKK